MHSFWRMTCLAACGLAVLLRIQPAAFAGAFEDGSAAYERRDYAAASRIWQKLADQGDAPAQQAVGLLYDLGYGVAQDLPTAVAWYRRAAEGGDAAGQYRLAFMYEAGLGVTKDRDQAESWYRKAAGQGLPAAEGRMAELADRAGNVSEAMRWAERAYADGDVSAAQTLCTLYLARKAEPPDRQQQEKWCALSRASFDDPLTGTEPVPSTLTQAALTKIVDEIEHAPGAPGSGYRFFAAVTLRRPAHIALPARHDRYLDLMSADGRARVAVRGLFVRQGDRFGLAPGSHIVAEDAMPMIADGGCSIVHLD